MEHGPCAQTSQVHINAELVVPTPEPAPFDGSITRYEHRLLHFRRRIAWVLCCAAVSFRATAPTVSGVNDAFPGALDFSPAAGILEIQLGGEVIAGTCGFNRQL